MRPCLSLTAVLLALSATVGTRLTLSQSGQSQGRGDVPAAAAQPAAAVRATIVALDGDDFLVDLGGSVVSRGDQLRVFRQITVRHPITKRKLEDRFAIGELTVVQPGKVLSIARVEGTPTHAFAVGDAAEARAGSVRGAAADARSGRSAPALAAGPPPAVPSGAAPASSACPVCPASEGAMDQETRELLLYWKAGLAHPPARRIELYSAFLLRHPKTERIEFVRREIAYLRSVQARLAAPAAAGRAAMASGTGRPEAGHQAPNSHRLEVKLGALTRATRGQPLWISAAYPVDAADAARGGLLLFTRAKGEDRYARTPMQLSPDGHARALVPQALVVAPGLEFFIEAVDAEGRSTPVYADASRPQPVEVPETEAEQAAGPPMTRVRFQSELVSFKGTSGQDYFLLTEGDFLYRLRYPHLYAVRMGYGHYTGQGGTVEALAADEDPRPAGFSYGFVEGQFSLSRLFGVAARATVGLGRPKNEAVPKDALTGGMQLRLRVGPEDGTRLEVAGELLPEVGQRAFIQLRFEAIPNLPMATEVHVTDQPVDSDELAVRLVYELGYRISDQVALSVRPSYQLRTIRHAGAGIGGAVTFDW